MKTATVAITFAWVSRPANKRITGVSLVSWVCARDPTQAASSSTSLETRGRGLVARERAQILDCASGEQRDHQAGDAQAGDVERRHADAGDVEAERRTERERRVERDEREAH